MEGCRTQEELPEQNQNPGPLLHTQNSSVPTALPALQHVRTSHQEGRCHLIKVFQANLSLQSVGVFFPIYLRGCLCIQVTFSQDSLTEGRHLPALPLFPPYHGENLG